MRNYRSWKDYQEQLPRKDPPRRFFKGSFWLFACLLLLGIGIQCYKVSLSTGYLDRSPKIMRAVKGQALESFSVLMKSDLRRLIDPDALCNSADGRIDIICSGKFFSIETTLDKELQSYMLKEIQASQSPMIGFVAMDPATGRILSMVDSKRVNGEKNICLSSRFPAASIFKIVSAAAAIDRCNISADTKLTYNGRRHTLYRNQLSSRTNRHTNSISLKISFATSINPVFGKLGIFRLKRDLLEEYAIRFGFNQPIDFELPVEISRISIRDDPYNWAEVACGFNRETLISPIHGAMMAAVIINDGRLVEPTIIGCITDDKENPVYIGTADIVRQVISREASQEMQELMSATISRGTCSGTFKGYRRDRILSKLSIGGKTGSISDMSDELHYDWFVGFCAEKAGTKKLALAVLVVHDELLREKAQEFARRAMRCYFRESVG